MSNVDKSVTEYVGGFVDEVIQNVLDIIDAEEMTEHEFETFVSMLQDRIEGFPTYSDLYE